MNCLNINCMVEWHGLIRLEKKTITRLYECISQNIATMSLSLIYLKFFKNHSLFSHWCFSFVFVFSKESLKTFILFSCSCFIYFSIENMVRLCLRSIALPGRL